MTMSETEYTFTEKQLERLRRASDITEIQMLMAKYVDCMSKMRAKDAWTLFAQKKRECQHRTRRKRRV